MFGYIVPDFSSLDKQSGIRYRQWYCGLCHALKRQSPSINRLVLSHDMTFLTILLSSLWSHTIVTEKHRCPIHPLPAHHTLYTPYTDYAADMNLLLAYHKQQDDLMDESHYRLSAFVPMQKNYHYLTEHYPEKSRQIGFILEQIQSAEQHPLSDDYQQLDRLCNLSGMLLGTVFSYDEQHAFHSFLYGLGAALGRFIYLMDAYDDLESDIKKNRYNPLVGLSQKPDFDIFVENLLQMFIAEAVDLINDLPLEKDLDILNNVMYSGVWLRYRKIVAGKRSKENKARHE